jgi:hypothetical protein
MTPLARQIYQRLLRRLRSSNSSITYGELAASLDYRHATHPRSPRFHAALTEITSACRMRRLPILPAIVWRAGSRHPAIGYFKVAHPDARTDAARLAAWAREHARVLRDRGRFPVRLDGQSLHRAR